MVKAVPRPEWQSLSREGTVGVLSPRPAIACCGTVIAHLRFAAHATIDEHSAPFEIDVICFSGEGFVSVGGDVTPFHCGEFVTWPARVNHRLWTEDSVMETLMVEHRDA